jgi:hypothetical protein
MTASAFRALTFDLALETYADEDAAARCIDLLTDARHWCDLNHQDFAELDRQAYRHYLAELTNDQPEERNSHD